MATTVPFHFEECPMEHLVSMIADMLERLIKHNDQIPLSPEALTRFHSRTAPSISVHDYLRRVVRYTNLERSCLLITLHYIDKMCGRLPRFTISSLTVHRFIIASACVSTKALCDAFCTNSHYAKIGGIKLAELNVLEREFLATLEWRLICAPELLQAYYVNLARSHSGGAFQVAEPPAPVATASAASSSSSLESSSSSQRNGDANGEGGEQEGGENEEETSPNTASSSSAAASSMITEDDSEVAPSPDKTRGEASEDVSMEASPESPETKDPPPNFNRSQPNLVSAPSSDHDRHKDENVTVPVPVPVPLRRQGSATSRSSRRPSTPSSSHSPSVAFPASTLSQSAPDASSPLSSPRSPQRKRARPVSLSRSVGLGGVMLDLERDRDGRRRRVEVPVEPAPPVTTPPIATNTAEAAG